MTGAALAVLTLLVTTPAAGGFRYVPATDERGVGETVGPPGGVAATPVEAERADPSPGPGPLLSGTRVWRVRGGETLRVALSRWGARAGADVTFLTDRRYRLDTEAAFEGAFPDAVEALLQGLSHLPHPPEGSFSADGRSLAVTHRARHAGEGEGKP